MSREPARAAFECFGGACEVFAVGARVDGAEVWARERHARYSRFDAGSELSRLNAAAGRWVDVSAELEAMLRAALEAYDTSGGLVHAGVLPALVAAGYGRDLGDGPTPHTAAAPPRPLPEMLEVARGRARLAPDTSVDLGGIAKGFLADRLAAELGDNALVNFGGDLYARGGGPEGAGWPVGFGDRTVLLRDMGAATSGTWKRAWGPGLHHLIDPRTGAPAATDLREASVLAPTAAEAETFAKTALLLGSARAEAWLVGRSAGWWLA
ncbi:MAG TPA: FAD:protein FMN transferase [Candidatus Limnocylindria bacterium]|nr:FAD:protein FMN transferase [Candidatus Limnocylindria bacterium]